MRRASNSLCRARPLLGTFVEIAAAGDSHSAVSGAIDAAFGAAAEVHRLMSSHERGSDVSRLNREAAEAPARIHPWTYRVLESSLELCRLSSGLFDITISQTQQALHSVPAARDPSPTALDESCDRCAIELLPNHEVRLLRKVRIDLGGIAKGFAVDIAIEQLREHGMCRGLVNAGGDLAAFGPEGVAVQIRDPRAPLGTMCRADIANEALASSAGRFEPFSAAAPAGSAVIDPRTKKPVMAVLGTSVRAPTCMTADALTKIVMIAGARAAPLLEHYCASALFLSADGDLHISRDWSARVRRAS